MDAHSMGQAPEGPQAAQFATYSAMKGVLRWLLWKEVPNPDPEKKPRKVPHYVNGALRGATDTPEDWAQLATYDAAKAALAQAGVGWGLAFALGPDGSGGHWQGIDFDDISANRLADLANAVAGYVEMSPSGQGAHAIGYGWHFATLGSNQTGIEAYAAGRFFTVTERPIRDSGPVCLAGYVEQHLAPRHAVGRALTATSGAPVKLVQVDAKTVSELRSALTHLRADDRHLWVSVGHALKELGEVGRELWLSWSQTSAQYRSNVDPQKWDGFACDRTGYQSVFKKAQDAGWVNPASNAAQLSPCDDGAAPAAAQVASAPRKLVGRSLGTVPVRAIHWLWKGWVPKGYITLMAGETGAGKTTVLADIVARVTTGMPWPGEFSVQQGEHVHRPQPNRPPSRVLWLGSEDGIEEMTVPRLMACGANLANVIEIQGAMQQGKRSTFSMQDDIDAVGDWLAFAETEGRPFAMLVIDPVTSYLPGQKLRRVEMNDAGQLRTVLEPWLILAQKHRIAVVCVTHFAKDTTRSMLHRVLGSAAFAQTCRSLIAVIEPPATEDYEPGPFEKAMLQVKVNLPEHPGGSWRFSTEKVEVAKDQDGEPVFATRPEWEELDTALTPKTAVGPARGPKSKGDLPFAIWMKAIFAVQAAEAWLQIDGQHGVKATAMRDGACPSESWWNKHSGEYLDKQNVNGTWWCRPKQVGAQVQG